MPYHLYKITNDINKRVYVGVHKSNNPNDSYYGSGIAIRKAIKKYGRKHFKKEIIASYKTAKPAYEHERKMVNEEFVNKRSTYNMTIGGKGGFDYINSLHLPSAMHDPEVVKKNTAAGQKTRAKNPEKYRKISIENLKKATAYNTGRKRPEHSKKLKELGKNPTDKMKAGWKQAAKTKLKTFVLVTPDGKELKFIGREALNIYCKNNKLPRTSIYDILALDKKFLWGKAKGYSGYIK